MQIPENRVRSPWRNRNVAAWPTRVRVPCPVGRRARCGSAARLAQCAACRRSRGGAAVREHRARLDSSARDGVPAHLTVLSRSCRRRPWTAWCSPRCACFRRVRSVRRHPRPGELVGEDVVWLAPRDDGPFRALTGAAFAAFPGCPPYGGRTRTSSRTSPSATKAIRGAAAAAQAVRRHLPVGVRVTEVALMAGPPRGTWKTRRASGACSPRSRSARTRPAQRRRERRDFSSRFGCTASAGIPRHGGTPVVTGHEPGCERG